MNLNATPEYPESKHLELIDYTYPIADHTDNCINHPSTGNNRKETNEFNGILVELEAHLLWKQD
jgi:hypothetical protein